MVIRKPGYYDRFQCIAGACKDNCCIGWEIDIDPERLEYYRHVPGELGRRLSSLIDRDRGCFILQGKEERCPFLNRDNLCDLILEIGEQALCDICREHPRYYDWFPGLTEAGVGLCCEAAARLILGSEEPVRFVTEESDGRDSNQDPEKRGVCGEKKKGNSETRDMESALFEARETAFSILQNRRNSVWVRLSILLSYMSELQACIDFGSSDEILESAEYYREAESQNPDSADFTAVITAEDANLCRELAGELKSLEFMDPEWPEKLVCLDRFLMEPDQFRSVEQKIPVHDGVQEVVYEQIAVYFIYRYFMKCREDRDVIGKGQFAVFSVLMIRFLDLFRLHEQGTLTMEDHVRNAVAYSKEIEYSEENMELLADKFISRETVSTEVMNRILHVVR